MARWLISSGSGTVTGYPKSRRGDLRRENEGRKMERKEEKVPGSMEGAEKN